MLSRSHHVCPKVHIDSPHAQDRIGTATQLRARATVEGNDSMLLKLIACEVLMREICYCVARTPHVVDIEFTEKGAHDKSDYLKEIIQTKIDNCEKAEKKYEAILLGYGLCGNATAGLVARSIPLIIPRAHDCCTLFLGSKDKFKEYFSDRPSTGFSSAGYIERGESYVREASESVKLMGLDKSFEEHVKQYGEDNAKYIWATLHPEGKRGNQDNSVVYIEVPETSHLGYAQECRMKAEADGKKYVELQGDIHLIRNLTFRDWNDHDFLTVQPGQRIAGVYDWEKIVKAEDNAPREKA